MALWKLKGNPTLGFESITKRGKNFKTKIEENLKIKLRR